MASLKRRRGITDEEKRSLRTWFHEAPLRPTHDEAKHWFAEKYDRELAQSTVSKIL